MFSKKNIPNQTNFLNSGLNEKNKFIQNFINESKDFISVIDKHGNRKFINKSAQLFLGYHLNELIDYSVFSIIYEEDKKSLSNILLQLPILKSVTNFQNRIIQKNGLVVYMSWTFTWDDETELIFTTGRDITAIKKSEEKLIQSERQFRNLITNLNVGVLKQGPNAKILISNRKAMELLGFTEDQLLGKTSFDKIWDVIDETGNSIPGPSHPVPTAIATKKIVENVVMGVYRPATKDRIWLLVNAVPELDMHGNIDHVICTFIDITLLKENEEKLRKIAWHQSHLIRGPLSTIMGIVAAMKFKISLNEKLTLLNFLDDAAKKLDAAIHSIVEESQTQKS